MTTEELSKIEEMLAGIDKTETDSDDGWWETESGAERGREILTKIRTMSDGGWDDEIQNLEKRIERLESEANKHKGGMNLHLAGQSLAAANELKAVLKMIRKKVGK